MSRRRRSGLITVLLQGNPPAVTNDTGLWRRAWTGLDLKHTITPVAVQDLKPEIHADTVSMLLAGDGNGLRILNDEYGTKLIVMAVAEPDMVAKKLTVTLAGQDAVGPLLLKRTYRMTNGDLGYTSELAAVIALGVLEGRWKAIKSAACTTGVDRRAGLVGLDGRPEAKRCGLRHRSSIPGNGTRSAPSSSTRRASTPSKLPRSRTAMPTFRCGFRAAPEASPTLWAPAA